MFVTENYELSEKKDIISIDEESAIEQQAKTIGANYQPFWVKQYVKTPCA